MERERVRANEKNSRNYLKADLYIICFVLVFVTVILVFVDCDTPTD